jgi:hypothetical protein
MLSRVCRAICSICKRSLPRAAARCPWCSYGTDEPARPNTPPRPDDTLPRRSTRLAPHQDISHRTIP